MTVGVFSTLLINSFVMGFVYALFASGLTLVFGVMNIVLFCHGALYMIGSFIFFYLFRAFGINYLLAILITMIAVGFLGIILERGFFRKVKYAILPSLFVAAGLTMIIEQTTMLGFGTLPRSVHSPFKGIVKVFGGIVSVERLVIMGIAIVFLSFLILFLDFTKTGRAIRAVAQDSQVASTFGINSTYMYAGTCFLGCMMAGAAGALMAPIYGLSYSMGNPWLMKGFMIIVLGGLGSITGSVVGGLILGIVESFGVFYFGYLSSSFIFIAVMVILILRPRGLMGHED
jgi:branched-chain amino acid transport system permease protein